MLCPCVKVVTVFISWTGIAVVVCYNVMFDLRFVPRSFWGERPERFTLIAYASVCSQLYKIWVHGKIYRKLSVYYYVMLGSLLKNGAQPFDAGLLR